MSLPEGLVCNARDHGLVGDGVTNDQPALQALVDALGAAYAADGQARVIHCPPGTYSIRDTGTVWHSGISLIGAGIGVTRFVLSNEANRVDLTPLAYFTAVQHGASRENVSPTAPSPASRSTDPASNRLATTTSPRGWAGSTCGAGGSGTSTSTHRRDWARPRLPPGHGGGGGERAPLWRSILGSRRAAPASASASAVGGRASGSRSPRAPPSATGPTASSWSCSSPTWPPPRGIRITACHAEDNWLAFDWGVQGLIVIGGP